jgi:N-acylneuraminate cytidylyltransferase
MYSSVSAPVILPSYLVQDIDTEEDWHQAELMFKIISIDNQ